MNIVKLRVKVWGNIEILQVEKLYLFEYLFTYVEKFLFATLIALKVLCFLKSVVNIILEII